MPLNGMVLKVDTTSIDVTGGTDVTYTSDGQDVKNGIHLSVGSVDDFRIKPHAAFRTILPRRLANGQFTMGNLDRVFTDMYVDSAGVVHYIVTEVKTRFAPVIPAAVRKNHRLKVAQAQFIADCEAYNTGGDLVS